MDDTAYQERKELATKMVALMVDWDAKVVASGQCPGRNTNELWDNWVNQIVRVSVRMADKILEQTKS